MDASIKFHFKLLVLFYDRRKNIVDLKLYNL